MLVMADVAADPQQQNRSHSSMADELIRRVNLVEILKEQLEDAGKSLPDDLADEQLLSLTEDQIKEYYQHPTTADVAAASDAVAQLSITQLKLQQQMPQTQLEQLKQQFPPQDSTAAFKAWFPALFSSRAQRLVPAQPKAVVLCFHSSGNAEDMYTFEGTGSRRVQSALLDACKANGWLLLAPQLPGRAQCMREQHINTLQEVAQQLMPLVVPALLSAGGKYGIVGHSLGCWTAYELILALKKAGLPDPAVVCFSAMPWPHIPFQERPWRQQKTLNEVQFKEECRGWDINEAVFSPGMWDMYQPLLRADFKLFDEYTPSNTLAEARTTPLTSKMRLFWGQRDRRVTDQMVKEWRNYAPGDADVKVTCVSGNHLWPIAEPAAKAAWLQDVAAALQEAFC